MELNKTYNECNMITLGKTPDNFIQLTITSPPYDRLRSYNSIFDCEALASELFRCTKPGGQCVWVVADQTKNFSESGSSFRQALTFMSVGWKLYDTMIWKKSNPLPTNNMRYVDAFEYMFVFSKGKPSTFNGLREPSKRAGQCQKWASRRMKVKYGKKTVKKHGRHYQIS